MSRFDAITRCRRYAATAAYTIFCRFLCQKNEHSYADMIRYMALRAMLLCACHDIA